MCHYYPFANGRYEATPNLKKLGTDFGNGAADRLIFQLDETYETFWKNKIACRKENIYKYYRHTRQQAGTLAVVNQFLLQNLTESYPQHFRCTAQGSLHTFTNCLTNTTFSFDERQALTEPTGYLSLLDALACQTPEDMAVWQVEGDQDYLSAIHLCTPNHWSPEEKIGKPFAAVHAPVAGMEALRQRYRPMLQTLLRGSTFVRFAWGLSTDIRLNHHPVPPHGVEATAWKGRRFDVKDPELYVRVERQTLTGFPAVQAILFTIRTYFEDVRQLTPAQRHALANALHTMSAATLRYKGLDKDMENISHWLRTLSDSSRG